MQLDKVKIIMLAVRIDKVLTICIFCEFQDFSRSPLTTFLQNKALSFSKTVSQRVVAEIIE